jgi:ribonuclease P protein component
LIGRISRRSVFQRLTREGVRVRSGALWCSAVADPSLGQPHVAYAIGRATGGAVERNRLRRRLREIVRREGQRLAPGWYLIGAHPGAERADHRELGRLVAGLVERLAERLDGRRP